MLELLVPAPLSRDMSQLLLDRRYLAPTSVEFTVPALMLVGFTYTRPALAAVEASPTITVEIRLVRVI